MAKGTTFGVIHSNTNLGLIQQKVEVAPAEPKTNFKDIPGADGSQDMTEAHGCGVKYKDREIVWTFALYPGTNWAEKRSEVSNAINGIACHITTDDDPNWYYDGRVIVSTHRSDKLLRQITVKAVCRPYKRKKVETTVSRNDLTTTYKQLVCEIGEMPLIPAITVNKPTVIKWGDIETAVSAGTHTIPDLFMKGSQTIKAKLTSGSAGTISITWREGSQ